MTNYKEVSAKLTNTRKLLSATKNNTGITLRITLKEKKNFANNMSTDIKFSKAQISKISLVLG